MPFKIGHVQHDLILAHGAGGKSEHALPPGGDLLDLVQPVLPVERFLPAIVPALGELRAWQVLTALCLFAMVDFGVRYQVAKRRA